VCASQVLLLFAVAMISNILQPLPITKLNANMPPSPSPTKKPHTAFTPTTASLLTSLNLEPPATPEQPDILTGRGYSNDELDLVAALESPAAKSSTNESSTPLISNDELDLVAALESPAAKSKSNYLVAVFESPAAKSNTTLTSTPINTFTSLERYLFHPNTLEYLLPTTFGVLPLVAKAFSAHASTSEPYWYTGCHALARVHDLYLPYPTEEKIHGSFKRIFFEQLFPARHKWAQAPVQASTDDGTAPVLPPSTDFKIQVASRFRPGERKKSAILLPLHQRLRLLRKQRGQATIGKSLPAEFIDPLMGGVMSDPVKLPSSGKVSERKIILAHLKSARTDPFDGTPLTPAQLLPCEELTTQLEEWRAAKQQAFHDDTSGTDDFRVAADDTKALTEMGGDITPEILQALLEADRLETDLKLAEEQASVREARKNRPKRFNKWGEEEEVRTSLQNRKARANCEGACSVGMSAFSAQTVRPKTRYERPRKREPVVQPQNMRCLLLLPSPHLCSHMRVAHTCVWQEETANENAPPPSETPAQPNPSVHAEADVKLSAVAKAQTETESLANIVNGPQKKDARVLAIEKSRVLMHIDGRGIRPFLMSGGCFAPNSTQTDVYAQCGRAPVVSALNGLNACLIAYGQTGSGKTHTMFGPEGVLLECWLNAVETAKREGVSVQDVARSVRKGDVGLAVRACAEICECLGLNDRAEGEGDVISTLSVQYVQIYNEQITCLLGSTNEVHMRGEMMQVRGGEGEGAEESEWQERPARTTGENDRRERPARTTGENDRRERPARTTGSTRPAQHDRLNTIG